MQLDVLEIAWFLPQQYLVHPRWGPRGMFSSGTWQSRICVSVSSPCLSRWWVNYHNLHGKINFLRTCSKFFRKCDTHQTKTYRDKPYILQTINCLLSLFTGNSNEKVLVILTQKLLYGCCRLTPRHGMGKRKAAHWRLKTKCLEPWFSIGITL